MKRNVFSRLGFLFLFVFIIFLSILIVNPFSAFARDPWDDGNFRNLNQQLLPWSYPKVVALSSGLTAYVVDVTQGMIQRLDMSDCPTSGASLLFTGQLKVATRTWVVWHGTGEIMEGGQVGSTSPIAYPVSDNIWPFPRTTDAAYTYVLEVISGIDGPGEISGSTIYAVSGATLTQ